MAKFAPHNFGLRQTYGESTFSFFFPIPRPSLNLELGFFCRPRPNFQRDVAFCRPRPNLQRGVAFCRPRPNLPLMLDFRFTILDFRILDFRFRFEGHFRVQYDFPFYWPQFFMQIFVRLEKQISAILIECFKKHQQSMWEQQSKCSLILGQNKAFPQIWNFSTKIAKRWKCHFQRKDFQR